MTKYFIAFIAILFFVFALSRFGRSAAVRKAGRIAMRVMSYIFAFLAALLGYLGFFGQQEGNLTLLLLALPLAICAGAAFKLSAYSALHEKEWFPQG